MEGRVSRGGPGCRLGGSSLVGAAGAPGARRAGGVCVADGLRDGDWVNESAWSGCGAATGSAGTSIRAESGSAASGLSEPVQPSSVTIPMAIVTGFISTNMAPAM